MQFHSMFNHIIKPIGLSAVLALANNAFAVPAKPGLISYGQPDGTTISVYLHGDESAHYFTSPDGYLLQSGNDGYFRYVTANNGVNTVSEVIARNPDMRSAAEASFIGKIDKAASFRNLEQLHHSQPDRYKRQSAHRVKQQATFPTTGLPKGLAILVEFADNSFTLENPQQKFHDQLNKRGYDEYGATGSVLDYFSASSNGVFLPDFDVYGPVKLSQNISYYGGDNSITTDANAPQMVIEACTLLDDEIDFSEYDADNDGQIDNVYIFYAGYGQADGGASSTVWPHSWDIIDAGRTVWLDGKQLNHYACSSELANGRGEVMSGIGVFVHEFSHVLGLPDLYATQYTGAFTPNSWTLMDNGSYNNDCRTPPLHTGYERYCLGWVTPHELDDPANVTLRHIEADGYRDVFKINTNKTNEYYIVENRQKNGWDQFLPGHGMLIWHIDYDQSVWDANMVNNSPSHQYVDIEEADNDQDFLSFAGDPFPGQTNVTSFTDETTPSMKTWAGTALHSPITDIKEGEDGVISFVFKGGVDIFDDVVATDATNIKADRFTANWNAVDKATSYLISVYTKNENGDTHFIGDYNRKDIGNATSYEVTGLRPLTDYYYVVYAFDGKFQSKSSNEISASTSDPTLNFMAVESTNATDLGETSFTANWKKLQDATHYTLTVYTTQLGEPDYANLDFTGKLENLPSGWDTNCTGTYGLSGYCGESAPSLKMDADANYLQSPTYSEGLRNVAFWYRGSNASAENSLSIQGLDGKTWVELEKISPIENAAGGKNISFDIEGKYTTIKFVYNRPKSGSIAIDDIKIGYGGKMEDLPIDGYNNLEVGDTDKFTVTDLLPNQEYAYDVLAHNDEFTSLAGNRIRVKLGDAGVETTTNEETLCFSHNGQLVISTTKPSANIAVYDITGKLLYNTVQTESQQRYDIGMRGMAIVLVDGKAFKVVIR